MDIKLSEIENYKTKVRLYINSFAAIVGLLYFIYHGMMGNEMAILNIIGASYFIFVVYTLKVKNEYLWQGRGFIIFAHSPFLYLCSQHPEQGVYWGYVSIICTFLIVDMKAAIISIALFLACLLYFVIPYFPHEVIIRIVPTLLLVAIFSFIFSYFIENLLAKMRLMIIHDPLTGAYNRTIFDNSVKQALNAYTRYHTPVYILYYDLDYFKKVNDNYGHQKGDEVLSKVTKTIEENLRANDLLFRYGGDEFVIILNHTNNKDVLKIAPNLIKIVESIDFSLDQKITISVGGSDLRDSDDICSWLKRCDDALYQAKDTGRNKFISL